MKTLLLMNLALGLVASPAFAAKRPKCSYAGVEKPFQAAVQNQLRADILALKEKGVGVVDNSVVIRQSVLGSGAKNEEITLQWKASFRSASGTTFRLSFEDKDLDHDGDGIIEIGPATDWVSYYPEVYATQFDPEGNPTDGHCYLASHGVVTVTNNQTGVVIATFPTLKQFLVR